MKDDPQRVTVPRAQPAHTVPHVNAIAAAFALHRTMVYRESHSITLTKRNDLWPRLHARTLFGKYKFSACKVGPWLRQQDRHLYGENMLAVKVLMQTVVVTLAILQQQGRWPQLSGIVASLEEFRMRLWIGDLDSHQAVPAIGNLCQSRIDGCSNLGNELGQWIVEVLIFASSETMSRHDDAASKEAVVWVERGQSLALIHRQDTLEDRVAVVVKLPRDPFPVERLNTAESGGRRNCSVCCSYCVHEAHRFAHVYG
jgi:hypothetical protein